MKVAVVGLGYVGLPLAVEFGKRYPTIGFDLSAAKVGAICRFEDPTGELSAEQLKASGEAARDDRRRGARGRRFHRRRRSHAGRRRSQPRLFAA